MLTQIPAQLAILALTCLTPIAALAAGCADYPLTQEQQQYIAENTLAIEVPEGEVPFIQRCDVDDNGIIDNNDLALIREHRGQLAAHPDDPMDWDGNGVIHGRDVGGCASSCTSNGCAVKDSDAAEDEGLRAGQQTNEPGEPTACFQVADITGDGEEDFTGIFEYTGDVKRPGDWTLDMVILYKDDQGEIQHETYPFSGRSSGDKVLQHVSMQPAGEVDLMPGTVTISEPGIVSYRNGEPAVLYYYQDGQMHRAFYKVNQ